MEEEQKGYMQRFKDWYYDNDLHLWLGLIAMIAGGFLIYVLHLESQKNDKFLVEIQRLNSDILIKDNQISALKVENSALKQQAFLPASTTKQEQRLDVASDRVKNKLEKVQDSLIKSNKPEVKTLKETLIIERNIKVDKELEQSMLQSFCTIEPENEKCKRLKK